MAEADHQDRLYLGQEVDSFSVEAVFERVSALRADDASSLIRAFWRPSIEINMGRALGSSNDAIRRRGKAGNYGSLGNPWNP